MSKVTDFIAANWKSPIAIIIYVILGIVIVYFVGKWSGKFINKPNQLPKDTDWGASLTEAESQDVRRVTRELHDDMDNYWIAIGLSSRNDQVYIDLAKMSDKKFTAVYNDFNDQYLAEESGTLKKWIVDEYGLPGDTKTIILQKFNDNNLK